MGNQSAECGDWEILTGVFGKRDIPPGAARNGTAVQGLTERADSSSHHVEFVGHVEL
tara:strand:- start:13044 stop:13214 length:171 start_codon:yes stop_codon:yes gene_type:complete